MAVGVFQSAPSGRHHSNVSLLMWANRRPRATQLIDIPILTETTSQVMSGGLLRRSNVETDEG